MDKKFVMTQSYDDKIINWNKEIFSELVNQMEEDEISDMNDWLACLDIEIDPSCFTYEAYTCEVVYEYIKQWLIQQINENIISGTQELLEIYLAI